MTTPNLDHRFEYHPPTTDAAIAAHEFVRSSLQAEAHALDNILPDGREKALVFTALEEAMMWANAAIARNGGPA